MTFKVLMEGKGQKKMALKHAESQLTEKQDGTES